MLERWRLHLENQIMKKHNIQNASPFATKQLGDKLNKVLVKHERKIDRGLSRLLDILIGAIIALGFVVAHGMLTTNWTW